MKPVSMLSPTSLETTSFLFLAVGKATSCARILPPSRHSGASTGDRPKDDETQSQSDGDPSYSARPTRGLNIGPVGAPSCIASELQLGGYDLLLWQPVFTSRTPSGAMRRSGGAPPVGAFAPPSPSSRMGKTLGQRIRTTGRSAESPIPYPTYLCIFSFSFWKSHNASDASYPHAHARAYTLLHMCRAS